MGKWLRPSQDTVEEIVTAYLSGESVPSMSRRYGTASNNLYRLLEKAGIKRDLSRYVTGKPFFIPRRKFNKEVEESIAAAYASGIPTGTLSNQHKCGKGTIRDIVKRCGVPRRNRGGLPFSWDQEIAQQIIDRYKSGESMQKLGWAFDLTIFRIAQLLRSRGIVKVGAHARGSRHGSWKGGRHTRKDGYVSILLQPDNPYYCMARVGGYVFEHRLALAQKLGRPLLPQEEPHHKNGIRSDNVPENLELWYVQRKGQRVEDLLDYIATYHRETMMSKLQEVT